MQPFRLQITSLSPPPTPPRPSNTPLRCYRPSCSRVDSRRFGTGPDGPATLCNVCYSQYSNKKLLLYQNLRTGAVSVRQTSASRPVRVVHFPPKQTVVVGRPGARKRKPQRDLARPVVVPADDWVPRNDLDFESSSESDDDEHQDVAHPPEKRCRIAETGRLERQRSPIFEEQREQSPILEGQRQQSPILQGDDAGGDKPLAKSAESDAAHEAKRDESPDSDVADDAMQDSDYIPDSMPASPSDPDEFAQADRRHLLALSSASDDSDVNIVEQVSDGNTVELAESVAIALQENPAGSGTSPAEHIEPASAPPPTRPAAALDMNPGREPVVPTAALVDPVSAPPPTQPAAALDMNPGRAPVVPAATHVDVASVPAPTQLAAALDMNPGRAPVVPTVMQVDSAPAPPPSRPTAALDMNPGRAPVVPAGLQVDSASAPPPARSAAAPADVTSAPAPTQPATALDMNPGRAPVVPIVIHVDAASAPPPVRPAAVLDMNPGRASVVPAAAHVVVASAPPPAKPARVLDMNVGRAPVVPASVNVDAASTPPPVRPGALLDMPPGDVGAADDAVASPAVDVDGSAAVVCPGGPGETRMTVIGCGRWQRGARGGMDVVALEEAIDVEKSGGDGRRGVSGVRKGGAGCGDGAGTVDLTGDEGVGVMDGGDAESLEIVEVAVTQGGNAEAREVEMEGEDGVQEEFTFVGRGYTELGQDSVMSAACTGDTRPSVGEIGTGEERNVEAGSISGVNTTSNNVGWRGFEVSVKADFKGCYRRLRIWSEVGFEEFKMELGRVFNWEGGFEVWYLDDEGDKVILSSDYDMPEMFNLVRVQAIKTLRVSLGVEEGTDGRGDGGGEASGVEAGNVEIRASDKGLGNGNGLEGRGMAQSATEENGEAKEIGVDIEARQRNSERDRGAVIGRFGKDGQEEEMECIVID